MRQGCLHADAGTAYTRANPSAHINSYNSMLIAPGLAPTALLSAYPDNLLELLKRSLETRRSSNPAITEREMALGQGDTLPKVAVKVMGEKGPEDLNIGEFAADKKVVIFAVPGAFTPTCSAAHLPGFVANADKIKAKGVDAIICLSVNDAFVMNAWGSAQNAEELIMAGDGNGDFTAAMGLTLDGSGFWSWTALITLCIDCRKWRDYSVERGTGRGI